MKENNYLDSEDIKLFFNNWLRLLSFVNDKYDIIKDFNHPTDPVGLNIQHIKKLREKLWYNVSIIDEFLKSTELDSESYELVDSWKNFIRDTFVLIRDENDYCVLLDDEKDILYGVKGVSNPISESTPEFPFICEMVIIPFKDKLVFDTIINAPHWNVIIGPKMTKEFNDKYIWIKKEKGITTRFD